MAQRGRKNKPVALRVLEGNKSKRSIPLELEAPKGRPICPDFLSDYAKEEWAAVIPILEEMGVLAVCDKAGLAVYCDAYGLFRKACEDAKNEPLTITTKTGNVIQNPIIGTKNAARDAMFKAATEFGLTPSSRARLGGKREASDDPIDREYFN
jgi:P27 family predicted phage terminase small subunit